MTEAEEVVDLVDEDDEVFARATTREVWRRNLLRREVAAIVQNRRAEIYVHRRADTKDVFPGMYDMFVAGVVASGESYEDAIRRELAEELAIEGVMPAFPSSPATATRMSTGGRAYTRWCGMGRSAIRSKRSPGVGSCPKWI